MMLLIFGLVLFLGTHSTRIVADDWRRRQIARLGAQRWKALYSLCSLCGLLLVIWSYGESRVAPLVVWQPPLWTRHLATLLMLVSFVLFAAVYVPGNRIKAALGHPMVAATAIWAFAHLLANGHLGDILLFASFLIWAIADFVSARRRDRRQPVVSVLPLASPARDALTLVVGALAWVAFTWFVHAWLFAVAPLG